MEKTRNRLMAQLTAALLLALLLIVVYESGWLLPGAWASDVQTLFWLSIVMELLTVVLIPSALYLFKTKYVHQRLTAPTAEKPRRLLMWATLRMQMLCLPMVLNTLFYYLFGCQVAFGYMAIILFLCLIMIYPSMGRCLAETETKVTEP